MLLGSNVVSFGFLPFGASLSSLLIVNFVRGDLNEALALPELSLAFLLAFPYFTRE